MEHAIKLITAIIACTLCVVLQQMSEAVDWNKYTVPELKSMLGKYKLPVSGVKAELINRLQEHERKLDEEALAKPPKREKKSTSKEKVPDVGGENGDEEMEAEPEGGDGAPEDEEEEGHYEDEHGEYEEGEEDGEEHVDHEELDMDEEGAIRGEKGDLELLEDSMDKELQDMMGGDVSETEEDAEFVTLDKCGDAIDDLEDRGGADAGDKTGDKDQCEPGETRDDESLPPLPPDPMRKFLYKHYASAKKSAGVCISKLSPKDVLDPSIVEWANRATFFCVNQDREGKGMAMLNFSTQQECGEAKEALSKSLGEEVKVTFIGEVQEDEVKGQITYEFDNSQSFACRTLIIDAAPDNATVDHICELFPEAVLVVKFDLNQDQYTWGHKEYTLPENIKKAFLLEYATAKAAAKVIEEEKMYDLGQKLDVKLVQAYEEKYKRYYAKKLNEAREKRWEKLERKRKTMKTPEEVNLSDEERLDLYQKMDVLTQKRLRIAAMKDIGWDEKLLRKNEVTAEILDIVRKVDADADRRINDTQKFPESVRSMTKHSRECFKRTPAYKNYQEYIAKKKLASGTGYRGRYFRGSSSRYDRGRDRESYGSRRRTYSGDYRDYEGKRRRVDDYDDRRGRHDDGTVDMLKSLTETLTHKMSQMERMLPVKEKYSRSHSRSEDNSRYYDNYTSDTGASSYSRPSSRQDDYYHNTSHHYQPRGESSYRGSRRGGYQGRNYNPNYRGRARGNKSQYY